MPRRAHDLVLLGATGFTGGLTAEYLAHHAPAGLRWALAGRSAARLETVRAKLAAIDAELASMPLVVADSADAGSMRRLAAGSRVVATTVGPYITHGEPLVAACAAAGTDYLDLTGEPEFVDTMFLRHQATALASGARLVHACGFDSIPHDLGCLFTVSLLPADSAMTVRGYVEASGAMSGGTFHSAVTAFSRGRANVTAARDRRRADAAAPPGRRAHAVAGRPHRPDAVDGWAVPLPTIDPRIVVRSARALERYGPDFRYSHFAVLPHVWTVAGAVGGVAGIAALAQLPPARKALLARLPQGEGPSPARRASSWFRVTFVGEGGGRRVVTRVSGGDPGYDETARMLAEAALCLTLDDLPTTAGQVTTAQAMGDALLARLQAAGLRFEVLDASVAVPGRGSARRC